MGLFNSRNSSRNGSSILGGNAQKEEKERVVYLRIHPMTSCVFKPQTMVMFSKFPAHGSERLIKCKNYQNMSFLITGYQGQSGTAFPTASEGPYTAASRPSSGRVFLATEKLGGER